MNKKKDDNFSQKLKEKLKELFQIEFSAGDDFQFESSEFDFGIYRIMNYKRKEIENFIENDLIKAVEEEFKRYKIQSQNELLEKIKGMEKKIKEDFGENILANGKLKEKYGEIKLVSEYLELKKQIEEADITKSIQSQTFNDLYNFFSRYYEDGDFISKRRYSSKHNKYAIPYDGEEVKLYWANFDQYYIKTGEIFKDYVFTENGWRFIFKNTLAEVEAGNVKGERRYFFLPPDKPVDIKDNTCFINFEYRLLTDEDLIEYPVKTKAGVLKKTGITQDDLNAILEDKIIDSLSLTEPKKILLEIQNGKTTLERHLYKFTRKITSDFFIHKDLKGFLERELDYFIKAEVLDIDSLDTEKEKYFDRHITRAKVVRNIGKRIIEFLSQIENFQKMLWEKKKFVLRTDYVITIDRIPEEFHPEIINNKDQLKEWEELEFGEINKKENLVTKKDLFGNKYKKLPVDTKYFKQDFKERLLEKLTEEDNLDDLIDGVLIKSENWQALNLLLEKYREKIQCIYIDPPFNTGTNEFLYKNKYLDSSWISMMFDRLALGKKSLKDDGSTYVRIDYHGNHYVRASMDMVFGRENHKNEILVNRTKEFFKSFKGIDKFMVANDYLLFYGKTNKTLFKEIRIERKEEVWWELTLPGESEDKIRIILGKEMRAPIGRQWGLKQEQIEEYAKLNRIKIENNKAKYSPIDKGIDSNWTDISGYSRNWKKETNLTENSEPLLSRVIKVSSSNGNFILDYFLGSGTTIAVAHKLGRKWIGVEMGEFFENIPLERMKKVFYGEKTGISKEIKWKGGGFFKYHYLEQYEDTLHNIDFPQEEKGQKILDFLSEEEKSEYLIKYMLKFETEGSPSLLNLKQFTNPFEYKLKIISGNNKEEIVNIDLVETFNYLIGLKINKYRYLTDSNGRKYVFVIGENNYRKVAIVWRSTIDINLEKDKENITKIINDLKPEEIYINGDSLIENYKPIESEFKNRAGV